MISTFLLACGPMTQRLDEDGLRLLARVLDKAVDTLDASAMPAELDS